MVGFPMQRLIYLYFPFVSCLVTCNTYFPVQKFDVLLNSYMRAGSSYTGRLLGYREDSFYWYEPLWSFNSVVYYRGKEEICSSNTHECMYVCLLFFFFVIKYIPFCWMSEVCHKMAFNTYKGNKCVYTLALKTLD